MGCGKRRRSSRTDCPLPCRNENTKSVLVSSFKRDKELKMLEQHLSKDLLLYTHPRIGCLVSLSRFDLHRLWCCCAIRTVNRAILQHFIDSLQSDPGSCHSEHQSIMLTLAHNVCQVCYPTVEFQVLEETLCLLKHILVHQFQRFSCYVHQSGTVPVRVLTDRLDQFSRDRRFIDNLAVALCPFGRKCSVSHTNG